MSISPARFDRRWQQRLFGAQAIGAELARGNPVEADLVIPVPDSAACPAAIGYAQQSGIPFELGIIRSHYVGRTFIQPADGVRHAGRQAASTMPTARWSQASASS
jgi:glutamine phosphoribosylpyrophosphate amidotransferase